MLEIQFFTQDIVVEKNRETPLFAKQSTGSMSHEPLKKKQPKEEFNGTLSQSQ